MDPLQRPPEWDLLLSAAQKNNIIAIRKYLSNGVDASHTNGVGQSALHIAALWGHVEVIKLLIEAGANVNAQNSLTGATPLHMAANPRKGTTEQRKQVINLLVQGGANPSQSDNHGTLAVDMLQEGEEEIRKLLEPSAPPLLQAIADADLDAVKSLVSPEEVTFREQTPMELAVEKLLEAQENDDQAKSEVYTKIVEAVAIHYEQTSATLDSLLDCMLNESAETWQTALLKRCTHQVPTTTGDWLQKGSRKNNISFLKFLIEEKGLDPNLKGRQGMTSLMFAARSGRVEATQYLLTLPNIDVNMKNDMGKTALDAATVNEKDEIVKLLQDFKQQNSS